MLALDPVGDRAHPGPAGPDGRCGGLAVPPLTAALLEALPPERAGLASGVFDAAREFGGGLGVALFGGLVAKRLRRRDARRAAGAAGGCGSWS